MKRRRDEMFTSFFGETIPLKSHRSTKRQVNLQKRRKSKKVAS